MVNKIAWFLRTSRWSIDVATYQTACLIVPTYLMRFPQIPANYAWGNGERKAWAYDHYLKSCDAAWIVFVIITGLDLATY